MNIWIAGRGLISPLGATVAENWQHIVSGHVGVRRLSRISCDGLTQQHAGELPDDSVSVFEDHEAGLAAAMIEAAGLEALGAAARSDPDSQLGLVLGTNFGVADFVEWSWRERVETGELDEETFRLAQDIVSTSAASLGAGGPAAQLSLSCASGAAVIATACQWLRAGRARRVLCIAYDLLTEFCWTGLCNLRTVTDDRLRPFDCDRSGTIFGEGAAAVLLTTDPIPGGIQIAGTATGNNAFHMTAPPKRAVGSHAVMQEAIMDGGIAPDQIDAICAHATGTVANDSSESEAIVDLLGHTVPTMAFKGNLGHLLGAAGLAEIILATEALQQQKVPGIAGLRTRDAALDIDTSTETREQPLTCIVTNSAGIGGNNASVCLTQSTTMRAPGGHTREPTGIALSSVSWALPGPTLGNGPHLPDFEPEQLLCNAATLDGFSARPYAKAVRGYLDPTAALTLAAINQQNGTPTATRTGIVAATCYGGATSGYCFFEQLLSKGHRLASPLLFPHAYASAASNLAAIELAAAGPHCVFWTGHALREAFYFAQAALAEGRADQMYVLAYESAPALALPDTWRTLPGAVCWRLNRQSDATWQLPVFTTPSRAGVIADALASRQG